MKIKFLLFPLSLYFRLVSFISVTAIIAFLTFSMIMIYSVEKHFEEQDVYDLKKINSSINTILNTKNESISDLINKIKNINLEKSNVFIYLENESGDIVFKSLDGPDFNIIINELMLINDDNTENLITSSESLLSESKNHETGIFHDKASYRIMISPINVYINNEPKAYTLILAMSTDFHAHYIQELKSQLTVAALLICILIICLVLFSVYQGHSPLRQVSRKIASITSENLNTRLLPSSVPIELRQLVISFNIMLEKIEDVFKRQSNFSGDIAHEMRTPITNLVTQTQFVLNHPRTIEEYQDLLYSNLEEYERMAKMVGDMLFLSQADNNQLMIDVVPIDLKNEIIKVFEYFEAWTDDRGITLHLDGNVEVIQGDPSMLRRVMNNLLSNAIRYTPKGETVTVSLSNDDSGVYISVNNPGEKIPEEHLSHLFDRFYRIDQSRQRKGDGSGIGLAIVKSIIEAHHGQVSVTSDSQLTSFKVFLPKVN